MKWPWRWKPDLNASTRRAYERGYSEGHRQGETDGRIKELTSWVGRQGRMRIRLIEEVKLERFKAIRMAAEDLVRECRNDEYDVPQVETLEALLKEEACS